MTAHHVDVAIVGVGSAGMQAYKAAKKYTDNIVVIEGGQFGTTCARVGCMPSKLLIAPAKEVHRLESFPKFGLHVTGVTVDGRAVMKRVRDERDRFVGFIQENVENNYSPHHVIKAYATFKDDRTLSLSNGEEITADRIVLAVGSRPKVPEMFKDLGDRVISSNDVFYWDDLPASVGVVGAGIIALELGQALHRLGVRVKIWGRNNRLLGLSDPEVSQYAINTFSDEFDYLPVSTITGAHADKKGVTVKFLDNAQDSTPQSETVDYLLLATGRQSNIDLLGLENTSLQCNEQGIPYHNTNTMQCGNSPVFIAGDATDEMALLHEAVDEGAIAGNNAGQYPNIKEYNRKTPLAVVFTDPQVAIVGQSYQQLQDSKTPFVKASADFEDQGRARVMLVNTGLMNLYAHAQSGVLLGAEMIGPSHEHLAHLLAWSIQQKLTVAEMLKFPFYHPTIEEGLEDGLEALMEM